MTSFKPLRQVLSLTTAISMGLPILPAAAQDAAPPGRVGQIAYVSGSVSFNGSGSGGWAAASLNYPVSDGDALYTQGNAQAAIALDATRLTLAGDTELQITQLDAASFAATASQGEVFLAVNGLAPGQNFSIATPRGNVTISQNGDYDVTVGDNTAPTIIAVFQGAATVTADSTLPVAAGQAAVLSGADQTTAQITQAEPDAFAAAMLAQAAPPPPPYVPPVVSQMTGTYELSRYGSWDQNPQYGAVWYPRVAPGWAPYREGHWVNVSPWGWTWVESEAWGFAPFHYGRWIDEGGRWGWAPAPDYQRGGDYGPGYQPVYAPAVVSFFGVGVVAGITAAALASGSVGWVPLGPEEPYYPSYRCPPDYVRRINIVNVRNFNNVNGYNEGGFTPDHYANRRAATFIPADAMRNGDPVARYGRPVPAGEFAAARPMNPGFSGGKPAGGQPDFRLPPPNMPLAHLHPGIAPQPSAFAGRPETERPNGMFPVPGQGGGRSNQSPAVNRAEPARPQTAPQMFQPQMQARPAMPQVVTPTEQQPSPQMFQPQAQARPVMPRVITPTEQRPSPPVFHPQEQQPAQPQIFHPQAQPAQQVFHPQMQEQAVPRMVQPPQSPRMAPVRPEAGQDLHQH